MGREACTALSVGDEQVLHLVDASQPDAMPCRAMLSLLGMHWRLSYFFLKHIRHRTSQAVNLAVTDSVAISVDLC